MRRWRCTATIDIDEGRASANSEPPPATMIRLPRRRTTLSQQRNRILAGALEVIAATVFATPITLVAVLHKADSHAVIAR
jgi:hypothetical protein